MTSWPFELLGAGFAVLALVFIVGGARRFVRVEEALEAGEYARLTARDAVLLTAIAAALGVATLVLVFVR